jgi:2-methylcitrate dehydratase
LVDWEERADLPTRAIVNYVSALEFNDLPRSQIDSMVRHILDSVACALGAFSSKPAEIARRIAASATATSGASVIGLGSPTTPEYATYANTVMVRHLDFNDAGHAGHISDTIPGILAIAESFHLSGREMLLATCAAYEVCGSLCRNGANLFQLKDAAIDQPWIGVSVAAGAGKLLGLTPFELANAVSLALVPSIPLGVVRTGELSELKGCATAHGSMNAVFGARLAKEGMTAPLQPFDGADGFRRVTGCEVTAMEDIGRPVDGLSAVEAAWFKFYPAVGSAQGPLTRVLEMAKRIDSVDDIVRIHLGVFDDVWKAHRDRSDSEFDPQTRETADHSLPYLIAVALTDKRLNLDSFTHARVHDPALRPLMRKVTIAPDASLTKAFQEGGTFLSEWPTTIEIELNNGSVLRDRSTYPKGSPRNPMSDDELVAKFYGSSDRVMRRAQADELLDSLWQLETHDDLSELASLFRQIG